MDIKLYNNSGEKNLINKSLTGGMTLEGNMRGETPVMYPVITISSSTFPDYNYMYIPNFNRYYFITEIRSVRSGVWEILGKVDVLMSFKSDIYNSFVVLADSEETGISNYLSGNVWTALVKDLTDIINFPNGLNDDGEYVLITAGG